MRYGFLVGAKQCGWDTLHAEVWDGELAIAMGHVIRGKDGVRLYKHYQVANKVQRAKIITEPGLFVAALDAREKDREGAKLEEGPEGKLRTMARL